MLHRIFGVNWATMLTPTVSLFELVLRGSIMYLGIFLVMRTFRRQKGALNAADFLVLVLVADAAQNALSAEYNSITEGAVVVGTIFFWDVVLDALAFASPGLNRLINGSPILLVKDGKFERHQLRKQMLTTDDVLEQLREQGINDLRQVNRCYMEADGHFSVIREEEKENVRPSHLSEGVA